MQRYDPLNPDQFNEVARQYEEASRRYAAQHAQDSVDRRRPMTIDQMQALVNKAVEDSYLFMQDGTFLSTAEGYNRTALAVLGTLIFNLGRPTFNVYGHNQHHLLGWVASRGNPLLQQAREWRRKYRRQDPSAKAMYDDVYKAMSRPLLAAHGAKSGTPLSEEECDAVCIMLLTKILWDWNFGNAELAPYIRMLHPA